MDSTKNFTACIESIKAYGVERDVFMHLFRYSDELKETMSVPDCEEVFLGILLGQTDLTKELLQELCNQYDTDLSDVTGSRMNVRVTAAEEVVKALTKSDYFYAEYNGKKWGYRDFVAEFCRTLYHERAGESLSVSDFVGLVVDELDYVEFYSIEDCVEQYKKHQREEMKNLPTITVGGIEATPYQVWESIIDKVELYSEASMYINNLIGSK